MLFLLIVFCVVGLPVCVVVVVVVVVGGGGGSGGGGGGGVAVAVVVSVVAVVVNGCFFSCCCCCCCCCYRRFVVAYSRLCRYVSLLRRTGTPVLEMIVPCRGTMSQSLQELFEAAANPKELLVLKG